MESVIPSKLEDVIDCYDGVYSRYGRVPLLTKTKRDEFIYILQEITREDFDESNWTIKEPTYENDYMDGCYETCICSQRIRDIYYITHKKQNKTFAVGCECIKKISEYLYNNAVKHKCQRCETLLMNRRLKYQNRGCCSRICYNRCEYTVKFGKYKGTKLCELPEDYVEWLYNGRKSFINKEFWIAFDDVYEIA